MGITILSLGKNKDQYIKEAVDEYSKRISSFTQIDFSVLPDISLTKTNNREVVIEKEREIIDRYLDEKLRKAGKPSFVIALDSKGKTYSSEKFAALVDEKAAYFDIFFIIGGVYGLSEQIKQKAQLLLSLSKMTFTHQMTRIIILEQLYRAFTIIHGKKYHY